VGKVAERMERDVIKTVLAELKARDLTIHRLTARVEALERVQGLAIKLADLNAEAREIGRSEGAA